MKEFSWVKCAAGAGGGSGGCAGWALAHRFLQELESCLRRAWVTRCWAGRWRAPARAGGYGKEIWMGDS